MGQLVLMIAAVAAVYLLLRVDVEIPPIGFVAINAAAVIGAGALAWRFNKTRAARREPVGIANALPTPLKITLAVAVVAGVTLPIWLVLYFVWLGGQLWR